MNLREEGALFTSSSFLQLFFREGSGITPWALALVRMWETFGERVPWFEEGNPSSPVSHRPARWSQVQRPC